MFAKRGCGWTSVVTIPNFAMRYVSRYLGHDAIRIAILVYRVSQCLDLQFAYSPRPFFSHHNRCRYVLFADRRLVTEKIVP